MIVDELQSNLQLLYEIETSHLVSSFITTNVHLKAALLASEGASKETVFFREEDGYLDIAVFIDDDVIRQLNSDVSSGDPLAYDINNYCYVLEGISHFLYLIHNGSYDRCFNLMEMELQAEVDKFIMLQSMVDIEGGGRDKREIHNMVFDNIHFRAGLSQEETGRYKDANFLAGKYCQSLLRDYIDNKNHNDLKRQLRRFYRLSLQEKIRRINQTH